MRTIIRLYWCTAIVVDTREGKFLHLRTDANALSARINLISNFTPKNLSPASIFIATSKKDKDPQTKKTTIKMAPRNPNLLKLSCNPKLLLPPNTKQIVVKKPIPLSYLQSIIWLVTHRELSWSKRAISRAEETTGYGLNFDLIKSLSD